MKVYALPKELEATLPVHDYTNGTYDDWMKDEEIHKESIKAWVIEQGFTGKHTGGILSMPIADGAAQYMLADGKGSFLLHLPYGDGYDSPDVHYLPKKEVVRRITLRNNFNKRWKEKG
jgi:hypothetical protein